MSLHDARWLVDGHAVSSYEQGRRAQTTVDVRDFAGGTLGWAIYAIPSSQEGPAAHQRMADGVTYVPPTGSSPRTVSVDIDLTFISEILAASGTLDIVRSSWAIGEDVPYPIGLDFLTVAIADDVLWPTLQFYVSDGDTTAVGPRIPRRAPSFSDGNVVHVLVDGNEALPRLLEAIAKARHHIHADWFFFGPDAIGLEVAAALETKARTGVAVRLMFNHDATTKQGSLGGGFDPKLLKPMIKRLEQAGVRVAKSEDSIPTTTTLALLKRPSYRDRARATMNVFKLRFPIGFRRMEPGVSMDLTSYLIAADHLKLLVVDGITGFCGGMNCSRQYLYREPFDPSQEVSAEVAARSAAGLSEAWAKWHDVSCLVHGQAARDLQRVFVERWANATGEELDADMGLSPVPAVGTSRVKVLLNAPGLERDVTAELVRMFRNATKRIRVANPYMTDDLLALYLVHAAKTRQVPVEIIVPDRHHDLAGIRRLMQTRYDEWLDAGIKIFEYQNHFGHTKVATTDGRFVCLGSHNFSKGSATRDYECNLLIDDPVVAAEVERRVFDTDRARSTAIASAPPLAEPSLREQLLLQAEPYL